MEVSNKNWSRRSRRRSSRWPMHLLWRRSGEGGGCSRKSSQVKSCPIISEHAKLHSSSPLYPARWGTPRHLLRKEKQQRKQLFHHGPSRQTLVLFHQKNVLRYGTIHKTLSWVFVRWVGWLVGWLINWLVGWFILCIRSDECEWKGGGTRNTVRQ